MVNYISNLLKEWYLSTKRDLPWRNTSDPYHIWVSEVILQQTRVSQGLSYYYRFIETFPNVFHLAKAPQDQILKLWQGLGYYSRARNMHAAAKNIVDSLNGNFPLNYKDLLLLKGVGEYTAAAIASIAYNEAVAVVDGNVIRVLSRLFAIAEPVNTPAIQKQIKQLANEILDEHNPALHNQAIMEFGALLCVPQNPDCSNCPLMHKCLAFQYKVVAEIPAKTPKAKVKKRYFQYLVIHNNGGFYFQKRSSGDIWEGLYEFPLIETQIPFNEIDSLEFLNSLGVGNVVIQNISQPVIHVLSHQQLHVTFIFINGDNLLTKIPDQWIWTSTDKIHELAVPRVIDRYLHSVSFNKTCRPI